MKTELDETKSKLFTVDQQLQKQTMRNIKIGAPPRSSNVKFSKVQETEAAGNLNETEVLKQLLINQLRIPQEAVSSYGHQCR